MQPEICPPPADGYIMPTYGTNNIKVLTFTILYVFYCNRLKIVSSWQVQYNMHAIS